MTHDLPILFRVPYEDFAAPPPITPGRTRVLIQKRGALGDILEATPILTALRAAYPDAFITWLAAENTADVLISRPDLAEVIAWDGEWWKALRRQSQLAYLRARARFWRGLRRRRYDIFISLEGHEMTWLPRASGAPRRVGMWAKGWNARIYQAVIPPGAGETRLDGYLDVARALGLPAVLPVMTLPLLSADHAAADRLLAGVGAGNRPLVVVHPMTNWITRNWPPERFAAVMDRLARAQNVSFVLTGAAGQREDIARIAALCGTARPLNMTGQTANVRELAALIGRADALLTGDTSAMHLAATVHTPSVVLFGATDYRRIAPPPPARCLAVFDYPPCGPCGRAECANQAAPLLCLHKLSVQRVSDALLSLLKEAHESCLTA